MKLRKLNKKGAGLSPYVKSILIVILFSFFIFGFAGNFIRSTNPTSEILGEKYGINETLESIDSSISNFTQTSENLRTQLSEGNPTALEYVFLIFQGAFYIPWALLGFVTSGASLLVSIAFPSLGGTGLGSILVLVMNLVFASIILTIVLLIVKAIRTGESER